MIENLSGLLTVTSSTSSKLGIPRWCSATEKAREQFLTRIFVSISLARCLTLSNHLYQEQQSPAGQVYICGWEHKMPNHPARRNPYCIFQHQGSLTLTCGTSIQVQQCLIAEPCLMFLTPPQAEHNWQQLHLLCSSEGRQQILTLIKFLNSIEVDRWLTYMNEVQTVPDLK